MTTTKTNGRATYYAVVDLRGRVVWEGEGETACAHHWLPGTYWGSGATQARARQDARRKLPGE